MLQCTYYKHNILLPLSLLLSPPESIDRHNIVNHTA